MKLKTSPPAPPESYDWVLFRNTVLEFPGVWIQDDDEGRPSTTAYQIRRGSPTVLGGCGIFDAVVRKKEGLYLRYVGIPTTPIQPWEMSTDDFLKTVVRTFDPALFPEGTPELFRAYAERFTSKHLIRLGAHTLPELDRHLAARDEKAGKGATS